MIDGDRVVHEVRYAHSIGVVWQALTDPGALAAWLMPNDFTAVAGHRFQLDARPAFGTIDGEVMQVAPPHFLQCRWTVNGVSTTVTVRLQADGDGTRLRLEHVGLPDGPRAGFDGGWSEKLDHDLALVLSGSRDARRSLVERGLHRHPELEVPQ